MITLIKDIVKLIWESSSKKIIQSLTFILLFGVIADFLLGYTYNYLNSQKITNTAEIQKIIGSNTIDPNTKEKLIKLENEILKKEHYSSSLENFIGSLIKKDTKYNVNSNGTNSSDFFQDSIIFSFDLFNIHFITSSWLIILSTIVSIIIILSANSTIVTKLIGVTGTSTVFLVIAISISFVTSLIPIMEYQIINYVLNILMGIVMQFVIVYSFGILEGSFHSFFSRFKIDLKDENITFSEIINKVQEHLNSTN